MSRRGFTLLELLVVVAIMGMMATVSMSSYRSMRQGMEESAVVRNASQFIRLAYQRSKIDRVPVNVYFWNETLKTEDDDGKLTVVGRASAVRKHGRVSAIEKNGKLLMDEFGDLDVYGVKDDEGALDPSSSDYQDDAGTWLYRVNGDEQTFQRSRVSRSTAPFETSGIVLISYPKSFYPNSTEKSITSYGFFVQDKNGIEWRKGDAYGLEFGDFSLPNGYVFGTSFSQSADNPNTEVKVMNFNPLGATDGGGETIQIGAIRPNEQGVPEAKGLEKTVAPNREQQEQNE